MSAQIAAWSSRFASNLLDRFPRPEPVFSLGLLAVGLGLQLLGLGICVPAPRGGADTTIVPAEPAPAPADTMRAGPANLPNMTMPIAGARVPTDPQLLPGARRGYRGGVHEGVDFRCKPGTEVRAVLRGRVLDVRDEPNLPRRMREELLLVSRGMGRTTPEVLEVLHGKRVTIYHGVFKGKLLVTTYSHLGAVRDGLAPGDSVEAGEVIGETGASGTSHAYAADGWGELHFEIHVDGAPLGLGLTPRAAGALYSAALQKEVCR